MCVYTVDKLCFLCPLQPADGSDDDEEGTALMIKPGSGNSVKEEKENEAFFRKVKVYFFLQ